MTPLGTRSSRRIDQSGHIVITLIGNIQLIRTVFEKLLKEKVPAGGRIRGNDDDMLTPPTLPWAA
jgi:hypothetical protein